MQHIIKIPLRELNEAVIKDLQEKYPDAEVSVDLHQDRREAALSEDDFWEIIARLDWSQEEKSDDAVVEPAIADLADGPVQRIYAFADLLSEKLYTLDQQRFAEHLGEDAWSPDRYFSVDNFLYARCCVIANGRELYESVLDDPSEMPEDLTFEALLYLPAEAYERKTGKEYDYIPAYPIETYSNEAGWK